MGVAHTLLLAAALLTYGGVATAQSKTEKPAREDRGWLGVVILNVTPETAQALQLQRRQGVIVTEVRADSAAERAGLHAGDVILSFNGEAIDEPGELPRLIRRQSAGAPVVLEIWREGRAQSIDAVLGPRPAHAAAPAAAAGSPLRAQGTPEAHGEALGLRVRVLTPAEAKAMGIEFGLRIEAINAAARAPLLALGDVIVGINNEEVSSVEAFNAIVARQPPGSSVALRVRRGLDVQYVAARVQG